MRPVPRQREPGTGLAWAAPVIKRPLQPRSVLSQTDGVESVAQHAHP
jgi:hypothetical protein